MERLFGHLQINAMVKYLLIFGFFFLIGCSDTQEIKRPLKSTYVPPSINYKGQFRKGYVRKSVSTNPNAIRNPRTTTLHYLDNFEFDSDVDVNDVLL